MTTSMVTTTPFIFQDVVGGLEAAEGAINTGMPPDWKNDVVDNPHIALGGLALSSRAHLPIPAHPSAAAYLSTCARLPNSAHLSTPAHQSTLDSISKLFANLDKT